MREGRFEQPNIPEENPEAPKPKTPEVAKPELAEGIDKGPRVEAIRTELIESWKQSNGQDILSAEGQDFLFGDPTALKRGERPMTAEQRAQKVFAERSSEDAQAHAEKEKTRIYENPADDPAIRELEENIIRITNQDVAQTQKGMWGEAVAKETSGMGYRGVWDRNFNRVNMQQWDNFLSRYPEKAAAYREKFEPIKRAFERQERLQQYHEQQERQERERVKTIDDDPTFRDFMDNPQTGLNARIWEGVSREESLTSQQYDEKVKTIRAQMMKEFALQHPDIAAQYGVEIAQTEQSQEAAAKTPETSQPTETEEEIEVEVEPSRLERIFAQRISDFERVEELREDLEQKPEQKSEQERGRDFFFLFSSLREPHRFEIDSGTVNQRVFEVKPGRESAIIIETDYRGNYRRWEVAQDGNINLIESGYGFREIDLPSPERQALKQRITEVRTIKRSGREAMTELEKLLKKFAEQVRKKAETK